MIVIIELFEFWEVWLLFEDVVFMGIFVGLMLGVLGVYIVLGWMVFLFVVLL